MIKLVRKRDKPDIRDYRYFGPRRLGAVQAIPPSSVDLRSQLPPVFDQGDEGSCGANAASAMMCFLLKDQVPYSRQQVYYSTRVIEDDVSQDAGVETRDLFKILSSVGAAPEPLWPYIPVNLFTVPPADVLAAASKNLIKTYARLSSEDDFLACLSEGFPFVLGFDVYSSLMTDATAKSGVDTIPNTNTEQLLGGHDVLVVGYDLNFTDNPSFKSSSIDPHLVDDHALLIRNSWGSAWGIDGHFWMPMSYAVSPSMGNDAWTARL